jgi:hypothetical protein
MSSFPHLWLAFVDLVFPSAVLASVNGIESPLVWIFAEFLLSPLGLTTALDAQTTRPAKSLENEPAGLYQKQGAQTKKKGHKEYKVILKPLAQFLDTVVNASA